MGLQCILCSLSSGGRTTQLYNYQGMIMYIDTISLEIPQVWSACARSLG